MGRKPKANPAGRSATLSITKAAKAKFVHWLELHPGQQQGTAVGAILQHDLLKVP